MVGRWEEGLLAPLVQPCSATCPPLLTEGEQLPNPSAELGQKSLCFDALSDYDSPPVADSFEPQDSSGFG